MRAHYVRVIRRASDVHSDHAAILSAIRAGDAKAARAAASAHLIIVRDRMLAEIEQSGGPQGKGEGGGARVHPGSRSPARTALGGASRSRPFWRRPTLPRFMRSTGMWPASPPMTPAFLQSRLIFGDRRSSTRLRAWTRSFIWLPRTPIRTPHGKMRALPLT